MSIIFEEDLQKYVDTEDMERQSKWGGAIYLPKGSSLSRSVGAAINAFEEQYALDEDELSGDGFWSSLGSAANWVSSNSGTIGNMAGAASKMAELAITVAKGAEEVKNIRALREKAMQAKPEDVVTAIAQKSIPTVSTGTTGTTGTPGTPGKPRPWDSFFKSKNLEGNNLRTKESITGEGFKILT